MKENTFKAYKNYGVLTREKRNIFTAEMPADTAVTWEECTLQVPDNWELYRNAAGTLFVTSPWGENYMVNDILGGDKTPCFVVFHEGEGNKVVWLKELS